MEQQKEASALGMWVFLVTEILFFGGLFLAYTIYRWQNARAFADASLHLDITLGTFNTAVLICQQPDDGDGGLQRRRRTKEAPRRLPRRDDAPGRRVPRGQGRRVHRTSSTPSRSRARDSASRSPPTRGRPRCSSRSTSP